MEGNVLNIVIVGIGHSHAEGVVSELRLRRDLFNIVGIVEEDEQIWNKKKTLPTFSGLRVLKRKDVLDKKIVIDGRTIEVNGIVVEEIMEKIIPTCQEFLSLKVPIHLDKPTGLDDRFIDFAEKAKDELIPFQIGYMYRYQPAIIELKKRVEKGEIGTISQFDITMDTDLSEQNRINLISPYPGGSMFVFGSHLLDLVVSIMGKPENTHVYLGKSGFDGLDDIEDNCIALLYYDHCCAVIKTNVVSANGYRRRHLVISGTIGAISIEPLEKPTLMNYTKRKPGGNGGDGSVDLSNKVDLSSYHVERRYQLMMENFAFMIKGQYCENEKEKMYVKMNYEYEMELHKLLLKMIGVMS